ncbi:MAG: hypothetical protein Ct9H90mP9_2280 [Pseudomonadota bacterium]|nr:MAG: hypothetical protein Ct9H90mP9_2280 [Pseudomonadota bacterium]
MNDVKERSRGGMGQVRGSSDQDLAGELGLTKGTVSRALNGYEDISKKTRKRVMEAATKRGYVPTTQAADWRWG